MRINIIFKYIINWKYILVCHWVKNKSREQIEHSLGMSKRSQFEVWTLFIKKQIRSTLLKLIYFCGLIWAYNKICYDKYCSTHNLQMFVQLWLISLLNATNKKIDIQTDTVIQKKRVSKWCPQRLRSILTCLRLEWITSLIKYWIKHGYKAHWIVFVLYLINEN